MGPLLYLTFCAFRNRLRMRMKRLKEPRYMIGLIVGIGYFWTVFGRSRPRGIPRGAAAAVNAESSGVFSISVPPQPAWRASP